MFINFTKRFPFWPQYLAVLEVLLLSTNLGLSTGWASPYLAQLTDPTNDSSITDEQASWIASFLSAGRVMGAIAGAVAAETIGSKRSLLLTGFPHLLGWAIIIFDQSAVMLNISRILLGFGMGSYYSTFPMYLGEVSNPKIRGGLAMFVMIGAPLGLLIGNIIGAKIPMWMFSLICTGLSLLYIVMFAFLPESPHYLMRQNQMEKARKSLEWYQRDEEVTQKQLDSMRDFVFVNKSLGFGDRINELLQPVNRRSIVIYSVLLFMFQISGLYSMLSYMEIILINSQVNIIKPSDLVMIVGAVSLISGVIAMFTVDKYGRRLLASLSCGGASISLFLLAMQNNLIESGHDVTNWQALPIAAILMYQLSITMGIIPIPSALLSELFAPNVKSTASCIANTVSAFAAFVTSKTYHPMLQIMTLQYVLLCYSVLLACSMIYCLIFIPETKGKSLQEIQVMMMSRKSDKS